MLVPSEYSPDGIKTAHEHRFNPIGTMFRGGSFKSLKELGLFGKISMGNRAFERTKVEESIVIPEGCKEVSAAAFLNTTAKTIELPSTLSYLYGNCFQSVRVDNLIFHGTKPPRIYGYWEFTYADIKHIYVPDESVDAYRLANLAQGLGFEPLSEYHS